jgi:hypothetical protein
MPGRFQLALVVAGVALAAPAAASAATFTVDPAAAAGCAGNVCKTISAANGAAADGDIISIKASKIPYVEAPIVVTKKNLTFEGQAGGAIVTSNGGAGTSVFQIGNSTAGTGDGTILKSMLIAGQENGGAAIVLNGKGTTLDSLFVARSAKSATDAAAILIGNTAAGTTTIKSSFVFNAPDSATGQTAPAIQGGTISSLVLQDTVALSGAGQGPAVALPGNDRTGTDDTKPIANQILRSTLYANQVDQNALVVSSGAASTVQKLVSVDSSILSGGQNGGGVFVTTEGGIGLPLVDPSLAGDVKIDILQSTIAGGTEGIAVISEADGADGDPAGNVVVNVDRSILKGTVTGSNIDAGPPVLGPAANTVKIDVKNSDAAVTPSDVTGVTITASGNQNSTPAELFVNPTTENFHLRHGSKAIDKGSGQVAGASDKDVDGEPRVGGTVTDLGADEFVNLPPVPVLTSNKKDYAVNETATFDGSKSVDPDQGPGGGVAKYVFAFRDGSPNVESATPSVQHAFATPGTYNVRLAVVDAQGVVSTTVSTAVVNVGATTAGPDGTAPVVKVASPKRNQVLRLYRFKTTTVKRAGKKPLKRTTKTRRAIRFSGTAEDAAGIGGVAIALRRVKLASAAQTSKCTFFDFKLNVFKVLSCAKPRYLDIAVKDTAWAYRLKKAAYPKLRAGTYELLVRATDKTGTRSDPVRVAFTFRIR